MGKILIVEDDPMILEIYNKKFSDAGFEVLTAESGDKVLVVAKQEKVDAILLDLIMPKMDGFEVIKHLRNDGFDPNIKIIVLSNLSQREDINKATSLGANGFVTKAEYSPSQLVDEVKRLLNQFKEQTKNEVRVEKAQEQEAGDAEIGEKKRILIMEDEEIFVEMFGEKLQQEGFEVISARNGAWGVKEAMKSEFDLFIIDMAMPAMNGDEIVEKLKLEESTKEIPIIMLSASFSDEARKKVQDLGVSEFYIKTQVTPSELANKAKEILKG